MRLRPWATLVAVAGLACLAILLAWRFGSTLPRDAPPHSQSDRVQQAAERLFARGDIQFDLPAGDQTSDGAEREPLGDWRVEERDLPRGEPWRLRLTGDLPPFWSLLVWMTAICCLFLLVYWLVESWSGFTWPGNGERRDTPPEPQSLRAVRQSERVLDEAERMAAEGRFADAIHALLLTGLAILRRRLGARIAAALTSREILALSDLPEAGNTALRDLVTRVELTYFGERSATEADYLFCRGLFEDFALAMRSGR